MRTLPSTARTPIGPTPTPAPPPDLPGLTARDAERVATALEANIAVSTRTVYASAWRQWEAWCRSRGIAALPAPPEVLAADLAERAEAGLSYGTLDLACSAIAYQHHQEGLLDPTADITLRRVRRGLRRIIGAAPRRQAHPLTVAEVNRIVTAMDLDTATGARDRALILLGYASTLRPSELSALHLADIGTRPGGLLVTVRRSKTDQDGYGQLVGVALGGHRLTDPVSALADWLVIRPAGSGPLFTRIHPSGVATAEPIGVRTVSRMVQARARAAGLDALPVSGHSLRAGHATTAAANGASIDRIAAQTRHRDLNTLMEHYIRPPNDLANTTSRNLGL